MALAMGEAGGGKYSRIIAQTVMKILLCELKEKKIY